MKKDPINWGKYSQGSNIGAGKKNIYISNLKEVVAHKLVVFVCYE